MSENKVKVLDETYLIHYRNREDDKILDKNKGMQGYCDVDTKEIVILNLNSLESWDICTEHKKERREKSTLRHEIVHAFLFESGLDTQTLNLDDAWATNEEMVDWIAIQGPKIYKAWEDSGAI